MLAVRRPAMSPCVEALAEKRDGRNRADCKKVRRVLDIGGRVPRSIDSRLQVTYPAETVPTRPRAAGPTPAAAALIALDANIIKRSRSDARACFDLLKRRVLPLRMWKNHRNRG